MSLFTDQDLQDFIDNGYVVLRQCFDTGPGSLVDRWRTESWERAGLDPNDPDSWPTHAKVLPATEHVSVKTFAPRVYEGICRIMGGEDKLKDQDYKWGNNFLMNYATGSQHPWVPCSAESPPDINWHVDGSWFRHYLDSPEQGILGVVLFSDMESQAGCTCFAPDSIKPIAEHLRRHPEGLGPNEFDWDDLIHQCSDFRECIGKAGDVVLLHPFIMHRGSQNLKRKPRFMENIVTSFAEPLNYNRADGNYNAIEQVVLNALGVDHLDFKITGEREFIPRPNRPKQTQQIKNAM